MFKPDFNREKILDDVARAAGETVGVISGLSRKIRTEIKVHVDDMATRMDLVPREDFERLEMTVKALQNEHKVLKDQIETLINHKKK